MDLDTAVLGDRRVDRAGQVVPEDRASTLVPDRGPDPLMGHRPAPIQARRASFPRSCPCYLGRLGPDRGRNPSSKQTRLDPRTLGAP